MKLKKEFVAHNSKGESILVPTGKAKFSGVVKGNKTLGEILELLKTDTTETAIVDSLESRFDAPREVIERDVRKVIDALTDIGAIEP